MFGDPLKSQVFSGAKWFVFFIDDCTRVNWLFLIKNKSNVSFVFPLFRKMVIT